MKVGVFTVVFPGNAAFFHDFFYSLSQQTYSDFSVLLLNDGINNIKEITEAFPHLTFDVVNVNGDIFSVRIQGFEVAIQKGYTHLIFSDSDDFMSKNRVEVCLQKLTQYPVVINDLSLVDFKGTIIHPNYWGSRLQNDQVLTYKDLENYNLIGFGNSALRTDILRIPALIPEIIAIDWWIFFNLVRENNCKILFTNQTQIYYRQHDQNMVGLGIWNENKMLHELQTKIVHFKHLTNVFPEYRSILDQLNSLKTYIDGSELNKKEYVEYTLKKKSDNPFWWENIKLPVK